MKRPCYYSLFRNSQQRYLLRLSSAFCYYQYMNNSFKSTINGKEVTFTLLGNATMPPFSQVTSVAVIPFTTSGELVVVDLFARGLDIPGGHVDTGETSPEQTLRRETMEEASMTLHEPVFIEAISSDYFDDRTTYMLVYAAFVDELLEFHENEESRARVTVDRKTFVAKCTAGDAPLMEKSIDAAWKLLSSSRIV